MKKLIKYWPEILLFIFTLIFSFWLMWHTFSYKDGSMVIATKVWSDFGSHIPLIRSFSFGNNIPPEFPLFSGEPIRYHFIFYFLVGFLEKIGLPLDLGLNLPSALSFTLLIITIYLLANKLFQSKTVGVLSVIFFLLNGSLSFLEFLKTHPLSLNIIRDIITNTEYPSFAPYGPGIVSAFWNLNIYTNQRHLALPLAILLLLILWLISKKQTIQKAAPFQSIFWGIVLGLLFYAHSSIFIMGAAILGVLCLFIPNQRRNILIIGLIGLILALPRALFLKETAIFIPHIKVGYIIADNLTPLNFLNYWFFNLGLFWIFLPLGFIYSSRLAKKILIAFFSLFIIGNTIQFSPEMASNHKFFNAFVIVGNMFVAFALMRLWQFSLVSKILVPISIFFLIFSGIIDFFPLKNDRFMIINDYPKNPDIAWIMKNTPKDATFLNSSFVYDSASLAGRKIFLGWPYFAWSLGYDTQKRGEIMKEMLGEEDLKIACKLLIANNIDYIEIKKEVTSDSNFPQVSNLYLSNSTPVYSNNNGYFILKVEEICKIYAL